MVVKYTKTELKIRKLGRRQRTNAKELGDDQDIILLEIKKIKEKIKEK